jgi:hypothetical protein
MGLWLPRFVVADGRSSPQEFGTGEGLQTGTTTSLPPWFLFLDAAAANTARAKRPSRMTSAMPPFDRYAAVSGVREHL